MVTEGGFDVSKSKPIILSTEMVCATFEGRKTQTRRVIKPQPPILQLDTVLFCDHSEGFYDAGDNNWACKQCGYGIGPPPYRKGRFSIFHAKYRPNDIVWVRETWGTYEKDWNDADRFLYKADYPIGCKGYWHEPEETNWIDLPRWRLSRYMPKVAARLFLKVTNVRLERLQDITELDAKAEGATKLAECENDPDSCIWDCNGTADCGSYIEGYKKIWREINEKRGFGWDANPWVWVYEFERVNLL